MTHLVVRNSEGECARTPPTPPMRVRVHAPHLLAHTRAYACAMHVHPVHSSRSLFWEMYLTQHASKTLRQLHDVKPDKTVLGF